MVGAAQPVHRDDAQLRQPPGLHVVDEPLYAAYLAETGLDHPGRDEVIASQPTDWRRGVRGADRRSGRDAAAVPEAHDPPPAAGHRPRRAGGPARTRSWCATPSGCSTSYAKVREEPTLDDLGLPQQVELFERYGGPVVDAADVLARPARRRSRLLCEALGIAFDEAMLSWPAGPARHRRRLGATLVRRRRGLDRLRAVLPRQRRPAARPPAAAVGAVPALLRRAGAVPTASRGELMQQSYDERNRDLMVVDQRRLRHRDEAGVSPFDSVVQGGDAVWEGLRLYDGRIFRLDRAPRAAAALGAGAGVRGDPLRRGDHRADPGDAGRQRRCATTCTSGSRSPAA